ncbi:uncharacterized protein LOC122629788 isoform X1 [Vespula pensylvanica]|uniref:Uncharacterized protein n=1 Tax=Vespula pensylvanica TaxID=30213 RepID=A0A834P2S0_VESPE|nr:uncharacterized protein LOC122629788 isoform X1 [Vespula pensylvanica]XP_043669501.1 uncharacterized protein LOC122629788 isoform X1 [Vespula pensylvanica]KAF7425775.1 hypothetical protein H0235_008213 [Vespula pensylvanica]
MRRKIPPERYNNIKKISSKSKNNAAVDGSYVLSRRAQAALLAVVEGILDESLEDAKNLAIMSGKNCVTYEEMEKALKRLCLRLNDHIVIAKNKYDFCITAHESSD